MNRVVFDSIDVSPYAGEGSPPEGEVSPFYVPQS